jgi:hypothetical protein
MRFYIKCDICNKEFYCEKMRMPKEICLIDGLDMCTPCRLEYNKRLKRMLKELMKDKFGNELKEKKG